MKQRLAGLKRQLWLGYAGRMLIRIEHGEMSIDDGLKQWRTIRAAFTTLAHLWEAWDGLGRDDPLQWGREPATETLAPPPAEGELRTLGWQDQRSGTLLPFALIALSLTPASDWPDVLDARTVTAQLDPIIDKVLLERQVWTPFVE